MANSRNRSSKFQIKLKKRKHRRKKKEKKKRKQEKSPQSIRMQATAVCSTGFILPFKGTTNSSLPRTSFMQRRASIPPPRAAMKTPPETPMVDYSSSTSVFPAEACETVGGEACSVEMFPEVKPATTTASIDSGRVGSEQVDREYFEYNEPKTVFPGEACDDLGGEFCEPEYQKGVHKETIISE